MRQAGFATDRAESDDEVIWDDAEEDEDAGSNAATESSSATHSNDGSEELEDSGEPLSHSSKFPGPSSLRDWSEDDDDEPGSVATLGGCSPSCSRRGRHWSSGHPNRGPAGISGATSYCSRASRFEASRPRGNRKQGGWLQEREPAGSDRAG
jgi:hypothetical protein